MPLDFTTYISDVGLVDLSVVIRTNSTITMEDAYAYMIGRVNDVAVKPEYAGIDVKATLFDARDGNLYYVYSDIMKAAYSIPDSVLTIVDNGNLTVMAATLVSLGDELSAALLRISALEDVPTIDVELTDRVTALEAAASTGVIDYTSLAAEVDLVALAELLLSTGVLETAIAEVGLTLASSPCNGVYVGYGTLNTIDDGVVYLQ